MSLPLIMLLFSSLTMTMFLAASPLALGLWILLMALTITLFMSILTSSWLSMMIFLIYIGGMLIMFIYFSALIPNQHMPIMSMSASLFLNMLILSPLFSMMNFTDLMNNNNSQFAVITMPYSPLSIPILMLIVLILFLALVSVVKITSHSKAPMRPFIYV
nr:NADH dehydrogenase subunit 6 [Pherusa bengalensis]